MTQNFQTLSEKEKEALRLLTNGHDAKSIARQLGLSVHTVNERLRDARRKMAVSSSREAARLLQHMEIQTPEISGDKPLGDVFSALRDRQGSNQIEGIGQRRRTGWLMGVLFMSLPLALYALASLTGSTGSTASTHVAAAAETAAVDAARQWLVLVDAGNWSASWEATGQAFKALNSNAVWADASNQVRAPLGAMKSRDLMAVDFAPAPPHGYMVVKFRTSYANKAKAVETVSLAMENGGWKVVGCTIS